MGASGSVAGLKSSGLVVATALIALLCLQRSSCAQSDAVAEASSWLRAPLDRMDLASLQQRVDALSADALERYLDQVLQSLYRDEPKALDGAMRREIFAAHQTALRRVDASRCVWTCTYYARYLLQGYSAADALHAIDLAEERSLEPATPQHLLPFLRSLRIDSLLQLERAIEAAALASVAHAASVHPLERARTLSQHAAAQTVLGRLDRASAMIADAQLQLAQIDESAVEAAQLRQTRFDVLSRQLNVFLARERYGRVRRTITTFRRQREAAQVELSPEELVSLRTFEITCDYLATQRRPETCEAVLARVLAALDDDLGHPRVRRMLMVFAVDLYSATNQFVAARRVLGQLESTGLDGLSPRLRWLIAPVASRLARLEGRPQERSLRVAQLRQVFDEMLDEWRRAPVDGDGTGFLRIGTRLRVVGELIVEVAAESGPEQALEIALAAQCCTTLARRAGVERGSVADLLGWLANSHAAAWVIVPSWYDSYVFVVDGASVQLLPAARASRLRDFSMKFVDELAVLAVSGDGSSQAVASVRAASDVVCKQIMPAALIEAMERTAFVSCIGAGLLGGLPVAALQLPDGRRVGEVFAISTTSSLPLAKKIATASSVAGLQDATAPVRVLLAATLQSGPSFATRNGLSSEPPEVSWSEIVSALPADATCLLDEHATRSALRRIAQSGPEPFALAVLLAHGEGASRERPAALGLTPFESSDGVLTARALASLPLAASVLLGACQSASGPRRLGDDDAGGTLVGACLAAGSECVVASRVPQRLSLYRRLAARYSEEVLGGVASAEALRRARVAAADNQLEAIAAAQIELFGNGQLRLPTAASRRGLAPWLYWSGALAAMLLMYGLVRRVRTKSIASMRT